MLGLAHADADMIRNFGTVIDDDAVRSPGRRRAGALSPTAGAGWSQPPAGQ